MLCGEGDFTERGRRKAPRELVEGFRSVRTIDGEVRGKVRVSEGEVSVAPFPVCVPHFAEGSTAVIGKMEGGEEGEQAL